MNRILFLLLMTIFLASCTRPGFEKSKLTIAFPDGVIHSASTADSTLSHIVVNVTIPGQTSLFYSWNMEDQIKKNGSTTPPSDVNFELNSGSGRMVQVLYVFNDNTTKVFDFQYGDKTVNITGTQVIVEVPLTSLSSTPNATGRIAGRYFTNATSGPTGDVDIRFTPPGKPAMVVQKDKIFGGWFNFFALSDIDLDYILTSGPDSGKKIFNQSVSVQSNYFKAADGFYPANILKGAVPLSYMVATPDPTNINEAKVFLWGWFGDNSIGANTALSGKKVCPDIVNGQSSPFFRYDNQSTILFHDAILNNQFPTTAQLLSTSASWTSIEYIGGSRSCSPSPSEVELENKLTLNADFFMNSSSENLFPYQGALRMLTLNGGGLDIITDGVADTSKRRAQLLPGLEGVVQEIELFVYAEGSSGFDNVQFLDQDKFPCDNVPVSAGHLVITNPSETPFEFSTSAIDAVMSSAGSKIIGMCFKNSANQNVGPGIVYWPSNVGGGSNNPYLRFEIAGASPIQNGNTSYYNLTTNVCYPVEPKLYISDGVSQGAVPSWVLPAGGSISISGYSLLASGFAYQDDTCTTAVATGNNIVLSGAGPFSGMIYFKSTAALSTQALTVIITTTAITETIDLSVNNNQIFNFNAPAACSASSNPGDTCPEGTIYIGSLTPGATSGGAVTDHYMTTPGGCGDVTTVDGGSGATSYTTSDFTPTCSGIDSVTKTWNDGTTNYFDFSGISNYTGSLDTEYGSSNTTFLASVSASNEGGYHAAARYCDKLSFAGYTDWFLPNKAELGLIDTNRNLIQGLDQTSWYWSSAENGSGSAMVIRPDGFPSLANANKEYSYKVRCVRRF